MTVKELKPVQALQWAPNGSALHGIPREMQVFLANKSATKRLYGYGYGSGWGVVFAYANAEGNDGPERSIEVLPAQWVIELSDGSFIVSDEKPGDIPVFDAKQFTAANNAPKLSSELASLL